MRLLSLFPITARIKCLLGGSQTETCWGTLWLTVGVCGRFLSDWRECFGTGEAGERETDGKATSSWGEWENRLCKSFDRLNKAWIRVFGLLPYPCSLRFIVEFILCVIIPCAGSWSLYSVSLFPARCCGLYTLWHYSLYRAADFIHCICNPSMGPWRLYFALLIPVRGHGVYISYL